MDIDAELNAGALDAERDGLARRVPDGIGCQFAGQQDRDISGDRGVLGTDGRPALAVAFGRRGRSRGQPDAARRQLGRAGWRHRVHRTP